MDGADRLDDLVRGEADEGRGLWHQDCEVMEGGVGRAPEVQLECRAVMAGPECRPGDGLAGSQVLLPELEERAVGARRLWCPEVAVQVDARGDAGVGVHGVGGGGATVGVAEHADAVEVERAA